VLGSGTAAVRFTVCVKWRVWPFTGKLKSLSAEKVIPHLTVPLMSVHEPERRES
jgi:hypothetical protein